MRILQISKADSYGGGASRVAEELTLTLNAAGHKAVHAVSWSGKPFSPTRIGIYGKNSERMRKWQSFFRRKFSLPEVIPLELPFFLKRLSDFDIFHFHDLASAISPITLGILARFKPIIWTIHDCSPFTGGCLYPMQCEGFKRECGNCPQLGTWPIDVEEDRTKAILATKKWTHAQGVITISPSKWMADMAFSSGKLPHRPRVIANGVDSELYHPRKKEELRLSLGLPKSVPLFVMSGGNLNDPRKGLKAGVEVLRGLKDLNPHTILLGNPCKNFLRNFEGLSYSSVGYVGDPNVLAKYYGAADMLLFCSQAENQPLTILEAMSVGTAVGAFSVGGVPELVIDGVNGVIAPLGDTLGLTEKVRSAFSHAAISRFGLSARQIVLEKFAHQVFLKNHLTLYYEVLSLLNPSRREVLHAVS
jgi:glycosyltransferase involved in cell wall biosynthesis